MYTVVVGWWFLVDYFFHFTYDVIDVDSNLHIYMLEPYAAQIIYYHHVIQKPLMWFTMVSGGALLFWKCLLAGDDVYIEFTRRTFLVVRGIAIFLLALLLYLAGGI